jgi:hypothetical protein
MEPWARVKQLECMANPGKGRQKRMSRRCRVRSSGRPKYHRQLAQQRTDQSHEMVMMREQVVSDANYIMDLMKCRLQDIQKIAIA